MIFIYHCRDRNAIKARNRERRLERQRTLEESVGITETLPNGEVVANGNVPHNIELPTVPVNEYADMDRHIVHATVHKENEGLSNGTIPVANGNCLKIPDVPPPDYEDATKVISNGDVMKDKLETNHVTKVANGDLINTNHVIGNGVIPNGSTKSGNLTDEQKAALHSSAEVTEGISHHQNEEDINTQHKADDDSLEGTVFRHGVENGAFVPEGEVTSEGDETPPEGHAINTTRGSLGNIHDNDGYIKELVYP